MIGIGMIGAGWWAQQHALVLQGLTGVRLVAACRQEPEALKAFTDQFGGKGYLEPHELVEDPAVDAVLIASPHHLHAEHAILAANAGKHVLLEKPMAPSVVECNQIIAACQQAGVCLMVGHTMQFEGVNLKAKELIQAGTIGQVVLGSSIMSKFWMESNRRDWHLHRQTGGGMLLTAGIHALDRLVWWMNSSVQSLSASLSASFHEQDADDLGLLFLRFANGATGTVSSLGYRHGAATHHSEIFGTLGHLQIDPSQGLRQGSNETWTAVSEVPESDWMLNALTREWLAFLEVLKTKSTPPVTGEYARHLIEIIEAAQLSAQTKTEVSLSSTLTT
jgi:phthalate 4,5-cis-dihydrodiol dehydrogenase